MATILVVDERTSYREVLAGRLGGAGHEMREATGGAEALAIARREHPDLVIAGILVPSLAGFELVRQMRADPDLARTPVIFATDVSHRREGKALARRCGAACLLTKPFEPAEVRRAVERALGCSEMRTSGNPSRPTAGSRRGEGAKRLGGPAVATRITSRRSTGALAEPPTRAHRSERTTARDAAQLQTLSRQLLRAQEEERRRIARELHDEIGQSLTAVKINLQRAMSLPCARTSLSFLRDSDDLIDRVLQQVRHMSLDLRPSVLDDLGLVASVRWYMDRAAERAGFAGQVEASPQEIRLAPEIETACFRIVQEALTNAVRHASARCVEVALEESQGHLNLLIRDDGIGFHVAAARQRAVRGGSLGLLGMQDRVSLLGGRMTIESTPGRGSAIQVRIPLS
jgi:signal transduction histidine kinase